MNTPFKILVVNTTEQSGGAARAAWRILEACDGDGFRIQELVKVKQSSDARVVDLKQFQPQGRLFQLGDWMAKKVKNQYYKYVWKHYPKREAVFLSDLRSTRFYDALNTLDYDILHLHWVNLRFLNLGLLKEVKKPIVWTLHDCWPFTGVCHYFYDCKKYEECCGDCPFLHSGKENDLSRQTWQQKQKDYQGLDLHIVTPSHWLGEAARLSSLFRDVPVLVIPNPIDVDLFSPDIVDVSLLTFKYDQTKQYILYGAMNALEDDRKGFKELNDAITILSSQKDMQNVEFVIFGNSDTFESVDFPIPTHLVGLVKDSATLVNLYRLASVLVVPSLSENLSNVIMEGLSCGTPVVAFNIGGNSDMVEHLVNGYLASANDCDDLANGLAWVLEEVRNTNRLSEQARIKVMNNFTSEVVGAKYRALYRQL